MGGNRVVQAILFHKLGDALFVTNKIQCRYVSNSFVLGEQVQLEKLISSFQHVTDDMKERFKVEGGLPLEEAIAGSSPFAAHAHTRITGFHIPIHQPPLASSAPVVPHRFVSLSSRASDHWEGRVDERRGFYFLPRWGEGRDY
jgi:hypothetical protein